MGLWGGAPSPALTSCCWDRASKRAERREAWTLWNAVGATVGWGSASGKPQADLGGAQAPGGQLGTLQPLHRWPCMPDLAFPPQLSSASRTAVRNPQASPEALSSRKQLFDSSWSFPTFRQLQGLGHCWGPTSHPLVGTESTPCHPPDEGGEVGLTGAKGGHARVRGKEVGTPSNHGGKRILKMLSDIFL